MNEDEFDHFFDQLISMRNLTVEDEARGHWWDTLKTFEAPVFKEAVRRMISEDEAYPSPAHVRQVCANVMDERLSRAVQPPPPSGLSQQEYAQWNREWRRQVVRGQGGHVAQQAAIEASRGRAQLPSSPPGAVVTSSADEGRVVQGRVVPQSKW